MTTPENTIPLGVSKPGGSYRGALSSPDFSKLFGGQLFSEVGNGAMQLAMPLLVLNLTNSAFQLGVVYFWQFLPMLLFGIVGGVFVDRWDRRMTIVIVDTIRTVAFLGVALVYYLDALVVEHLYALMFIESAMANFFNPARAALLPNLVDKDNLRPANSLMEVSRHIGFLPAPVAGGVAAAFLGPAAILVIDGITFGISAVTVFLIKWRQPPRVVEKSQSLRQSAASMLRQTGDGLAVIKREKLLQVSMLLGSGLNLIIAPITILLPLFVRDVKKVGDEFFPILVGGLLVGLIVGSLTAPLTARRIGLGPMAISAICVLGIVVGVASWPPGIIVPLISMFIAGVCIGSLSVAQTTMLQSSTTDDERGRVSAAYFTFTLGVRPLSYLTAGILASAIDIRYIFVFFGLAAFSLGLFLLRIPQVREHR